MSKSKFPLRTNLADQLSGEDDRPAPIESKSAPEPDQKSMNAAGVEYGTISFPPLCPHCTREKGEDVRTVCRSTRGPLAYFYCPACNFSVKHSRPWRSKGKQNEGINVAARPEMG